MRGSKTSDNTIAWVTFLAWYLLICLMISLPAVGQTESASMVASLSALLDVSD